MANNTAENNNITILVSNSSEPGFKVIIIPAKPKSTANDLCQTIRSCKKITDKTRIINGMEELIAVAAVKCIVDSPYVQEVVARNKIIPLVK